MFYLKLEEMKHYKQASRRLNMPSSRQTRFAGRRVDTSGPGQVVQKIAIRIRQLIELT